MENEANFPWRLYVDDYFIGDETNSFQEFFYVISRTGMVAVARMGAEIKVVDALDTIVFHVVDNVIVWPEEFQNMPFAAFAASARQS